MLNLVKGHQVSLVENLFESFTKLTEHHLMANVHAEKILEIFQHFIVIHDEPLFFILELPVSIDREKVIAKNIIKESHKDVYYIDGCSREECLALLIRYGDLLVNDGLSKFGFGGHKSHDEIMLDSYNVVTIYSKELSKFNDFFEAHNIQFVEELVTAWKTFSKTSPGISELYESNGKTVYDLPEELAEWGIYLAETRTE
ncbi:hypothetical protein [Streptococcus infantis]|uniref:hypothetical protein n=1 Tax=Streptococcus infantis TaxID=68892 RepID=UPI001CBAAFEE|nr:hypothetical protein [Streptococcus infantis]MBZ2111578.1 hypothetical protein [Streptococcus infantis]MBZ2113429.1 hypothetical protein [Streptococcus infantis]MBZ2119099.1 hypothetical protein [Streptococcus infantis]